MMIWFLPPCDLETLANCRIYNASVDDRLWIFFIRLSNRWPSWRSGAGGLVALEETIGACQWLDNRPTRGLQQVTIPVSEHLAAVAMSWVHNKWFGASHSSRRSEGFGWRGRIDLSRNGLDEAFDFTVRLPRLLVFVAVDSEGPLYISIRPEEFRVAFSSNHQSSADVC